MNSIVEVIATSPMWLNALYVAVLLFFALPIILKKLNETVREYRKLFSHRSAADSSSSTNVNCDELSNHISELAAKVDAIDPDQLASELAELRKLISNNPREILELQKLSIEFELMKKELVAVKGNSRWLIGTIVTLALGTAAIIVSVMLSTASNG